MPSKRHVWSDLRRYDRAHLDAVAHQLNARPRKTLGWQTPAQRLRELTSRSM